MIMLTVTKPRRKLKRLLKGGALLLLLGVVVPGIYYSLQTVGAMSLFVADDKPAQVEQSAPNEQAAPLTQTESEETESEETLAADSAAEEGQGKEEPSAEEPNAEESNAEGQAAAAADTVENTAKDSAETPAESSAENSEPDAKGGGLWAALQAVLFGDRGQVIPYEPGA